MPTSARSPASTPARREHIACDAVVIVTARLPNDALSTTSQRGRRTGRRGHPLRQGDRRRLRAGADRLGHLCRPPLCARARRARHRRRAAVPPRGDGAGLRRLACAPGDGARFTDENGTTGAGMTRERAIEVRNVSKRFGDFQALDDVSFTIGENEFFTLLGPSGCGKTTMLRMVAGLRAARATARSADRRRHRRAAAAQAAGEHRVPELRAVPAHVGGGERRLRARDAPAGRRRSARRGCAEMLEMVQHDRFAGRRPRSSRAGSGSASRWPARWRRSRRCCCSTSRCRRST